MNILLKLDLIFDLQNSTVNLLKVECRLINFYVEPCSVFFNSCLINIAKYKTVIVILKYISCQHRTYS